MPDWSVFLLSALAVMVAGSGLALCADVLAQRTGLGALWFGAVFVALVTSLPELVTDVAAVRRGAADLALGDLFGSSMGNMAILAAMTLLFHTRRLLQRAALEHVLTSTLAISVTAVALLFISTGSTWAVAGVGVGPLVIAVVYALGTFAIRERQAEAARAEEREMGGALPLVVAQVGFVVAAAVILVAGPFLARSADHLADQTGLGETFFGSFALALVTSLPELAVSVAAIRIGAVNLAIANLMGSNATNMALLVALDIASPGANVLAAAAPGVQAAAAAAIILMAVGTSSIVLKAERVRLPVDLAAVLILAGYVLSLWAIYDVRGS